MHTKDKGFTVVEVLLAVAIFLLLFGAFMGFYIRSLKSHKLSDEQIDANCTLRNLQRIFVKDLQEMGFGELRSSIHPLKINKTGSEIILTLQMPNTISHLKYSTVLLSKEIMVFDSVGLNANDNAVLISSDDAIRVTIETIDGNNIALEDELTVVFNSNSRLITYSSITYRWNRNNKTLSRLINGNLICTWHDVDKFQIDFYDNNGDIIIDPSNSTKLTHAQSLINIQKDGLARSALADFRTHLHNAGAK